MANEDRISQPDTAADPTITDSAHLKRMSIAASEELRKTVRSALMGLFGDFFGRLPGMLHEAAGKATNPSERNSLLELARQISAQSSNWVETLVQHIDTHLIGGELRTQKPAGSVSSAPADESISLAKLELNAEAQYQKLITELDARVNRLRLMLYVPVYTKALAPAGLFKALSDVADTMEWPPTRRRFLFEQFNNMVIPWLDRMYRSLIDALTRIAGEAMKAVGDSTRKAAETTRPVRPKKSATAMQAPEDVASVDPETVAMLKMIALKVDGEGYTDGLLAADLLALSDHRPLPGVGKDHSWVPIQRVSLAGHFLNEVISDPMVPDALKPQHETVRMPLVKSALTDQSLFTAGTHPLGSLVNELLLKAATSRITGNVETRRIAELLQQVLVQFDLAPEFVRLAMRDSAPIPKTQIDRFFELQRQQAQQRRDFVISEAKRMVMRQIEQCTFGRGMPEPAMKFLNMAWGPLLTKRLLQHGADHPMWKAGVDLMDQLLDQLDARIPDEDPPGDWLELTQTMSKALVAEGMSADRVKMVINGLEAARRAPPSDAL